MLTEFIAQIPFHGWTESPFEYSEDPFLERVLKEVTDLSGKLAFPLDIYGTCYPEFEIHDDWSPISVVWSNVGCRDNPVLGIKFAMEIPQKAPPPDSHCPPEDADTYHCGAIGRQLCQRALDFATILGLVRPGKYRVGPGEVYADGQLVEDVRAFNPPLDLALEAIADLGWPRLSDRPINELWSWAMGREGFLSQFGGNRIDRAFTAYSHLGSENGADLFWAMLAIESLFTRTNIAVKDQVVHNTQLLLGELPAIKKRLDRMYDFRSRLIHGDMDFPGAFWGWDDGKEFDSYEKGYDASLGLAIATSALARI
jgi:hypothetical protein